MKLHISSLGAAFAICALSASPVLAADETVEAAPAKATLAEANRADAQCLALTSAAIGTDELEAGAVSGMMASVGYFYGRIEARAPDADFGTLLNLAIYDLLVDSDSISDRCANEMELLGNNLVLLGDSIDVEEAGEAGGEDEAE